MVFMELGLPGSGKNMRKKDERLKKNDLLLIGCLLLAAGALWLLTRPGGAGGWAVVTVDGAEAGRYPLGEDARVTIEGAGGYNVLKISGGAAAVVEADCGDLTCVRTGSISREGERIVCLPHKVIVEITGGGAAETDAVSG